MKKAILSLIFALPLICNAQAYLGSTASEIKANQPDRVFKTDYAKDGTKYMYTEMTLGTFYYYFDIATGLSNMCMQIPNDLTALNTQVEVYNKKYVIKSETAWKAYLEGGAIINIKLKYDEDTKLYVFYYTQ